MIEIESLDKAESFLMGWYVQEGNLDKAESFFNHMVEVGGKPNSSSWETLDRKSVV